MRTALKEFGLGHGADTGPANPHSKAGPGGHRAHLAHEQVYLQGRCGWAESKAGSAQSPGLLAKPASRNCPEVPPPDGTLGCLATGGGAAGGLCAAWSKPDVAPTSCAGSLPSRPPPFLPLHLASRSPCPWHSVHLAGSHDTLVPTCFEAKLHRKRSGPTPDVASALTDRASPAMATYTYTSRPRALPCQRRRYRDNLMQP